jgi:hypothetical protein
MSGDFVVWEADTDGNYCALGALQGVDAVYEIKEGKSRAQGFPKDAKFEMDKRFPKDIALADGLYNSDRFVVVSARLKAFLDGEAPPFVEYLQVTIENHKGRAASRDYFIVHPVAIVDCIDMERSKLVWNSMDPGIIANYEKLVLLPDRIDPALLLFRPKHSKSLVVIRGSLAEKLEAGGFTGLWLNDVDEFTR